MRGRIVVLQCRNVTVSQCFSAAVLKCYSVEAHRTPYRASALNTSGLNSSGILTPRIAYKQARTGLGIEQYAQRESKGTSKTSKISLSPTTKSEAYKTNAQRPPSKTPEVYGSKTAISPSKTSLPSKGDSKDSKVRGSRNDGDVRETISNSLDDFANTYHHRSIDHGSFDGNELHKLSLPGSEV